MPLTGVMILLFVIFHIAHYTVGVVQPIDSHDMQGRHDVYAMVIAGFTTPWISILYIVAQFLLMLHLSHGISSVFQTLGLNTQRTQGAVYVSRLDGRGADFCRQLRIVIGVWSGQVK